MKAFQRFEGVNAWVFDLDNTLYPAGSDLWAQLDQRMMAFIGDRLGLDAISARALQKFYYDKYGATLRGLMIERAVDPHEFLDFVHDIDRTSLQPNPGLKRAIQALPGRKFVFTNGSLTHAEQTLAQLGLSGLFDGLFDIAAAGFVPKPKISAYEKFFARFDIHPAHAAMFEDLGDNLRPAHQFGMATILVSPSLAAEHGHHIEYSTEDLAGFIGKILNACA